MATVAMVTDLVLRMLFQQQKRQVDVLFSVIFCHVCYCKLTRDIKRKFANSKFGLLFRIWFCNMWYSFSFWPFSLYDVYVMEMRFVCCFPLMHIHLFFAYLHIHHTGAGGRDRSVAMTCGTVVAFDVCMTGSSGIFNNCFTANLPQSVQVKEFLKSVNIWRRYGEKYGGMFF